MSFRRKNTKNGYLTRGNGKVEDIGKWGVEQNKIFECEEEKTSYGVQTKLQTEKRESSPLGGFL
jgi:hypothetical protein